MSPKTLLVYYFLKQGHEEKYSDKIGSKGNQYWKK